jgi:hypothetical protein
MKRARKEQIVWCYLVVTGGRLPENLDNLLGAMREVMPDIAESDLRTAIAWALRQIPLRSPKTQQAPASAVSGADRAAYPPDTRAFKCPRFASPAAEKDTGT